MASVQQPPRLTRAYEYSFLDEPQDFSLVLGGPLFQLFRRSHLAGDGLELLHRRVFTITLLAWVPLLLLATIGSATGRVGLASFVRDIAVHARFLIALPILVIAEVIVHSRIRPAVRRFIEQRIVTSQDLSCFRDAVKSAVSLRNSVPLELGILALVYTVGLWVWNSRVVLDFSTWYELAGSRWQLTPAGYWYVFVSIPLFQFILLRWYVRLFIWYRFLWQVSRMDLNLIATHPDRCAGLAFLGKSAYAFGPIVFAQGVLLAGLLANTIFYRGESLLSYKLQIIGSVAFFVLIILGPLVMFTPCMARAKRKGLAEYGLLAQRYVESFEQKWVRDPAASEELLGTGDIQSLADLDNSYAVIREMRPVPFGLQDIARLSAAAAAPLVPLLLTIFSPEELLMRIFKLVF